MGMLEMAIKKETLNELENVQIYNQIQKFLKGHEYNSERTRSEYESDIRFFFREMKGKTLKNEIEYLSLDNIQLTLDDFEDYRDILHEEGMSNKSINRRISPMKELMKYLAGKKLVNDISFLLSIKSLPETDNSYGVLETWEVLEMARLASLEKDNAEIKRLMILLSLDTCIRKSALMSIKWTDFTIKEEGVLIKWVDKGNKDFRQLISHEFYKDLLNIRVRGQKEVFKIGKNATDDLMKRMRDKMNIPSERRIVWHSIRKTGVTFRYRLTGDILEAMKAAGHSRPDTTMKYLQNENYGAIGAVSSSLTTQENLYEQVDNETLLKAISMCNKDLQLLLNMKLKEIQTEIDTQKKRIM